MTKYFLKSSLSRGDCLYHHGVKGMKWGVRKSKKSNTKTKKGLSTKQKIAIGVGAAAVIAVGAYFTKNYLAKYGNTVIKSGSDFQRMSRGIHDSYDKPFYASHLKKDNKNYSKNDLFGTNWKYKNTLSSKKDIKVAGKKVSEKTYIDWVKSNKDIQAKLKKSNPNIDFSNSKQIRKTYDSFNRNLNSPDIRDQKINKSFFDSLSKKGYQAIRDRNDQIYSKMTSPVLIFENLKDVKVKDIKKVK